MGRKLKIKNPNFGFCHTNFGFLNLKNNSLGNYSFLRYKTNDEYIIVFQHVLP